MTEQSFANVRNCFGAGALCVVGGAEPGTVCDQAQPDSTKVNKRDKNPDEATADQQKMNAADRNLTARIRKSVMADKTLSTYAHTVKIISQNGIVTMLYSIRSERLLMEEVDYSMLFRWFVGMNLDEPVWDVTVFTKNRNRLLEGDVAREFLC